MEPVIDRTSPISRGNRVKLLRRSLKLSRKALGEKYDIPPGTIQNWEDGRFGGLTEKGARKVILAFEQEGIQCELEWLMYGTGNNPIEKSPMVTIPAQQDISLTIQSQDVTIARELECFYQLNRNAVDAILSDNSMEPYFFKGDHVAGKRYFGKDIKQLIGYDCIMQTQQGDVLVRRLQKGKDEDSYQLVCHNVRQDTEQRENIKLFSAAPVVWIRRKNPVEDK